jgi:hypothetical protein
MADVRDFGAVGDGVADDTAAIEHALADGDGLLVFPRGEYRISRPIEIDLDRTRRTGIDGSGGTARIVMTAAGPAFSIIGRHERTADPKGVTAAIWDRQRMPTVRSIEITGTHPEADGIRLEGFFQATITGVLLRQLRNAIHVTRRGRNLLVSHCHVYRHTGVGILLDDVNLHQTIIASSHISYCRLGGIRVVGGEIRNLQITGNDIEYNNNRSIGVPDADAEPTAEIFIDCRTGTVREGTIASNTIQATASPGGANIRFLGTGSGDEQRTGMWTIAGNVIGSQAVNIHLAGALGFAISGNYIYSGHERSILVEGSRLIAIGANVIGHNADYVGKELSPCIRLVNCRDSSLSGLVLQDAIAGRNTVDEAVATRKEALVEIVRCRRISLTGCQILEGTPAGLLLEDSHDILVSGCTILDARPEPLMRTAIEWRSTPGAAPATGSAVQGCRLQDLAAPEGVATAANVIGPPAR